MNKRKRLSWGVLLACIMVLAGIMPGPSLTAMKIETGGETKAEPEEPEPYVHFPQSEVSYIIGENDGVASVLSAEKSLEDDQGVITYSIENNAESGLICDEENGQIRVADYALLGETLNQHNGVLTVEVTAEKSETDGYPTDSTSYELHIAWLPAPEETCELNGIQGENGWYTSPVTILPKDPTRYRISDTCMPESFAEQISFASQIYLRDLVTGGITAPIFIEPVKSDTERPDTGEMRIEFLETHMKENAFYNPSAVIRFTAKDAGSGIDHFDWTYTKADTASAANPETESGRLKAVKLEDGETAAAELTLTADEAKQYCGTIAFTATDKAGLESEVVTEDTVFVVDTICPICNVTDTEPFRTLNGTQYYGGDVEFVFTITESNFYAEDVRVMLLKDESEPYPVIPVWTKTGADTHVGTYTISGDGAYVLSMTYTDKSGNEMEPYLSGPIVIDGKAPDISNSKAEYSRPVLESVGETVTFGFYNPSVTVTVTAEDENSGVEYFTWKYLCEESTDENLQQKEGGRLKAIQDADNPSLFTAALTLPKSEAEQFRGQLFFTATDVCGNSSESFTKEGYVTVVDTIAPTLNAEYSPAERMADSKRYYHQTAEVRLIMTEANFFAEDVTVTVTKNETESYERMPEWKGSGEVHIGTLIFEAPADHSKDGEYVISVSYTDRCGNGMKGFASETIVIDTMLPKISVAYANQNVITTDKDSEGKERKYFDEVQTATVTVKEQNFPAAEAVCTILAKDVSGNVLAVDRLVTKSGWKNNGDEHTMTITYHGDANYTFDISCTDFADNTAEDYAEDRFTVDKTGPENLSISYSKSVLETVRELLSFGFYRGSVKVTISAEDSIAGIHEFISRDRRITDIKYTDGGRKAAVVFELPAEPFYDTISFAAVDRSGNSSELKDTKRIVVDMLAPKLQVSYSSPVQTEGEISYYDEKIPVTLAITEANFYAEDVVVTVVKNDGIPYTPAIVWNSAGDVHAGAFALTEDGEYRITVSYTDKSGNAMPTYTSGILIVDTVLAAPTLTINGRAENGRAYKGEVIPSVFFADRNFENYEVRLLRTSLGDKGADVSEAFLQDLIVENANGGFGTFDTFARLPENDGIYTFLVTVRDKAGHECTSELNFTVNRFGSVYEYSDYLAVLTAPGGNHVTEVSENLVITEYNADRLTGGSPYIEITRDGKPMEHILYEVSPVVNACVPVGESGWFQYEYKIDRSNFTEDGMYKVCISSKDATGNTPENSIFFWVDSTAPEITGVTGLEKPIINASEVTINYAVYDAVGLKSVTVYLNGRVPETAITDFGGDRNQYEGSFVLRESPDVQQVRIVVEDLAGNCTDTGAKNFESAYPFNHEVTVSTNTFVRLYADKRLFWSAVIGSAAVLAGMLGLLAFFIRKNKHKTVTFS